MVKEVPQFMRDLPPFMWINRWLNIMAGGRICNYCFKVPEKLSRCSGCSRVSYCSKECQGKDWNMHKPLCKELRRMNSEIRQFAEDPAIEKNRQNRMLNQSVAWSAAEDRSKLLRSRPNSNSNVAAFVADFIRDQQKCSTCIKSPWEAEKFDPMIRCEHCLIAYWCSEECKKEPNRSYYHSTELCALFREQSAAQHIAATWAIEDCALIHRQFSTKVPHASYISLNKFSGWEDYETLDPDGIKEWKAKVSTPEMLRMHPAVERGVLLQIYEAMSLPFSILAACEDAIPDITTRNKLSIHVIGAGPREVSDAHAMEQILHFLPSLQILDISYVGPRLAGPQMILLYLPDGKNIACDICESRGRSRVAHRYGGLYHDVIQQTNNDLTKPDLFVVANPGFGEQEKESWMPTLKYILDSDIPALFASFYEGEGQAEEKIMKDMGAKIVVPLEKNKWRGVLTSGSIEPMWSPLRQAEIIGHSCSYRYVVKGRS